MRCPPFVAREDPFLQPISSLFSGVGTAERVLFVFFMAMACTAMVIPPFYGYRYEGNFWAYMFGRDDAMTSMSADVFIVCAAWLGFIWHDAIQLRISLLSLLVMVGCCAVALSFPMPVYFAFRTLRVAHAQHAKAAPRVSAVSALPLIVLLAIGTQIPFILGASKPRR